MGHNGLDIGRSLYSTLLGFKEAFVDTNTLLIIIILLVLFGGGGFYGRGRWW